MLMEEKEIEKIQNFIFSNEFKELQKMEKEFNCYKALGIEYTELPHSNILAYFFNPDESHGCEDEFLKAFIEEICKKNKSILPFEKLINLDSSGVRIFREYQSGSQRRIDIIIDFYKSKTVFAIENKIESGEGCEQLKDYQEIIDKTFRDYHLKVLLFLTPAGGESLTVQRNLSVSYMPISYSIILNAFNSISNISNDKMVNLFIENTIEHIKEDIMGEGKKQNLINQIWSNPEYACVIRGLIEHRPMLNPIFYEKCKDKIIEVIKNEYKCEVKTDYYPLRGDMKEIKFHPQNLPFLFMIYYYPMEKKPLAVRVLLYKDSYSDHKQELDDFYKANNMELEKQKIKNWSCWYKVIEEDEQDEHIFIKNDLNFNEQTIEKIINKIREYMDNKILKKFKEKYITSKNENTYKFK